MLSKKEIKSLINDSTNPVRLSNETVSKLAKRIHRLLKQQHQKGIIKGFSISKKIKEL